MGAPFWRRPMALALVASLIANAFLVAAVAGHMAQSSAGPAAERQAKPRDRLERLLQRTPAEIHDVVRREYAQRRVEIEAAQARQLASRLAQVDTLRATPFDRAAFAAAQAEARAAASARREAMHRLFVAIAEQLDAEKRGALADRIEKRVIRRFGAPPAERAPQ